MTRYRPDHWRAGPFARSLALAALFVLAAPGAARATDADLYAQARERANAGQAHAALTALEAFRRVQPQHREAALLQLYLLTDTQQFEAARDAARALVQARPQDAGAWLAAAYAWRHGGDPARALGAYQRAGALEPDNRDAQLGQVLMLRATGASERALALAETTSAPLEAALLDGLRQDVAAQLIRTARDAPATPAERAERLARAERLLAAIRTPGPGVLADQLELESVRGAHAAVLARYGAQFEPASAPRWATRTAAASALALRQPARALALYEALLATDPRDTAAQQGRFHALADLGRFEEAQASADGLADYLARTGDAAAARSAQVLRAYARAWAGQYEAAQRILDQALARTPQDNELRSALAHVLAWAEMPVQARVQFERVLAEDPEHLDARTGMVALAQQAEALARAQTHIDALALELGETHESVRALRREQRALRAPWVWAQWRSSLERGADAQGLQMEAGSTAWGTHNLRLLAGLAYQRYAGPAGELVDTRTSVGVQAGTEAAGLRARVHRLSHDGRVGARLAWSGALDAAWQLELRASRGDDDVAAAARLAGVSATRVGVDLAYRPQLLWRAWGALERGWLSDGNATTNVSVGAARRWESVGARQWELAGSAGLSQAALDTVPYFSPRRAGWLETQVRVRGMTRVAEGTQTLTWRVGPLLGLFSQTDVALKPYAGADATLTWEATPTLSLGLKASSVYRPYDGQYVWQHSLTLSAFGRLP
jgi:tetratricopeptide (TPR) repeat protein